MALSLDELNAHAKSIRRNIIRITDLPSEAQHKLFNRKHFRESMGTHSLRLLGHGHDGSLEREVVSTEFGDAG